VAKKVNIVPTEAIDLGYNSSMVIDGKLWLSGCGNAKARIMVIAPCPDRKALSYKKASSGQAWLGLYQYLREFGLDPADFYFTYVVKHAPAKAKPSGAEIRECAPYLELELRKINPVLIICLGSTVWGALKQTKSVNFSDVRGTVTDIEYKFTDCEWNDNQQAYEHVFSSVGYKALPIFNPEFLDIAPKELPAFKQDIQTLKAWMAGDEQPIYKPEYTLITTVAEIDQLHDAIVAEGKDVIAAIDCEWHGDAWYKDHKLLRLVQLCIDGKLTVVIALTGADGTDMVTKIDDLEKARLSLKTLLECPRISIIGQNVKEDALWLKACMDIEIMDKVIFDTMMAESLLNQNGPFGLEDLALKYTDIPRWAIELERWKKTVDSTMFRDGYGLIPDDILEPYAAVDVIATYKVFEAQGPLLDQCGYFEARGDYPSLFENTIQTQIGLFEVETTGLPVDTAMLDKMIALFETKVAKMSAEFIAEAEPLVCQYLAGTQSRAVEDIVAERVKLNALFNPDSNADVQQLLFKVLGITPFKTTKAAGGKLWEKAVAEVGFDDIDAIDDLAAATDGDSLTILAEQHPLVQKLLDYRRIAQIRKTWMRYPEVDALGQKTGGIYGDLGTDFRLHPSFIALCETGRLSTKSPNSC
jgi:uracil-DNA glycosylase family 4